MALILRPHFVVSKAVATLVEFELASCKPEKSSLDVFSPSPSRWMTHCPSLLKINCDDTFSDCLKLGIVAFVVGIILVP